MRVEDVELLAAAGNLARTVKDANGNLRAVQVGTRRFAVPYVLAQTAVPVMIASNGTVAADGTLTLGTALSAVPNSGVWVRLPAGAIVGGSAGLYWAIFSTVTSAAVKAVFIDPSLPFVPYVPGGVLAPAVGSGSAYTQTAGAEITLINVPIPGGALGDNGSHRSTMSVSATPNANSKTFTMRWAGQSLSGDSITSSSGIIKRMVRNRGASNVQHIIRDIQTTAVGLYASSVNSAADTSFTATAQLAVATDNCVIESFILEVLPS